MMYRQLLGAVVFMAMTSAAVAAPGDADRAAAFREAARKVAPCVVTIETVGGAQPLATKRAGMSAAQPQFVVAEGPTTGLIWSADGLILTSSFNFVRDPAVITVTLTDGRRFVAALLARDEIRRLAMLKIDATGLPTPRWAELSEVRVGQWALGLGRGHGATIEPAAEKIGGCTLTAGIVSGLERMSGLVVQTDTNLSPPNFGGPLVDLRGRVIGLCVPIGRDASQLSGVEWYDSGIGFAVPHVQAEQSARELAVGHNVRYGLLGIVADPRAAHCDVVAMRDPSPALAAGLRPGDRIVGIGERKVTVYSDLTRAVRPLRAGTRTTIHIERDNKTLDLPITLAVYEDLGPVPAGATEPDTKPPKSIDEHQE